MDLKEIGVDLMSWVLQTDELLVGPGGLHGSQAAAGPSVREHRRGDGIHLLLGHHSRHADHTGDHGPGLLARRDGPLHLHVCSRGHRGTPRHNHGGGGAPRASQ